MKKVLFSNREWILTFIFFFLSTLCIFPQVLDGYAIVNGNYLYNFAPWESKRAEVEGEYNPVLSDSIDWPNNYYYIDQIKRGELPIWGYNEQLGKVGIFTMYNLLLDPLRLLLWILLGIPIGITWETIIRFTLGGVFAYYFLKELKVNRFIAYATSIGFIFGSSQISSYLNAFSFAPLFAPAIFLVIEKLFTTNKWKYSILLGLSLLYLGSLAVAHVVFFLSFWVAVYILMRLLSIKENKLSIIKKLFVTFIFTVSVFSVYLLPSIEFFMNGINLAYREGYGLEQVRLEALYTIFFANIFGQSVNDAAYWIYGTYTNISIFVGFLVPIGILTGGVLRLIKKRDFHILFFTVAALVLLFNIYDFPFEKFQNFTNMLPLFHGNPPPHQRIYFQLFIFIVGALGLQYIWETDFRNKWIQKLYIFAITILVSIFSIYKFKGFVDFAEKSKYLPDYFVQSLLLVSGLLIVFLLMLFQDGVTFKFREFFHNLLLGAFPNTVKGERNYSKFILIFLIVLFLIEAQLNSSGWVPYMRADKWFPSTETTEFIKAGLDNGRVMSFDMIAVPETLSYYGFPVAAGRGSIPSSYLELLKVAWPNAYDHPTQTLIKSDTVDLNNKIWDLVNVKYFVGSKTIDTNKFKDIKDSYKVHRLSDSTILENIDKPAYAFMTEDAVEIDSEDKIAEVFNDKDFDINTNLIVIGKGDLVKGDTPALDLKGIDKGKVESVDQKSSSVDVKINAEKPGYLVLSQYYYPGWNAYIDGKKIGIFKAYGFLSAIKVEDVGEHKVEFKYEPDSIKYGVIISIFGILSAGVFYTLAIRREKHIKAK